MISEYELKRAMDINLNSPTKEMYDLLKDIISIMIDEGFSLEDMKTILKHALLSEIIKRLDSVDDKLDFALNCDYFWEYFDKKSENEYSVENIIKRHNIKSKEAIELLEKKNRTKNYKYTLNDI